MAAVHLIEPYAVVGILVHQFPRIASIGKHDRAMNTVTGRGAVAAHLYDQSVGLSWHILGSTSTTTERQCEVNIDLRVVIAAAMALLTRVVTSRRAGSVLVLLVGDSAWSWT